MRLGNLKIGMRLGFVFGLAILLTMVLGMFAIDSLRSLSDLTTDLYKHPFTVNTAGQETQINVTQMHSSLKDVALAKDVSSVETAALKISENEKLVYQGLELLKERFLGDKKKLEAFENNFTAWKPIRDKAIGFKRAGAHDKAINTIQTEGVNQVRILEQEIADIIRFAKEKAASFIKKCRKCSGSDNFHDGSAFRFVDCDRGGRCLLNHSEHYQTDLHVQQNSRNGGPGRYQHDHRYSEKRRDRSITGQL